MCPLHNSLIVILIIFIPLELVDSVPPDIPQSVKTQNEHQQPKMDKPIEPAVVVPVVDSPKLPIVETELKPNQPSNNTVEKSTPVHSTVQTGPPKIDQSFEEKSTELGPGAINRAVIVFVVISLAFFLFVGVKTCRRKHMDKSRVMIRKYGVRTNRSDIEMEPLPLSDEEDYDTLFDITASRSNLK